MIQCPDCRQMIPDDSAFCDQCGKELRWCPECRRPKRGTECPVCGSYLVDGRKWLSSAPDPVSAPAHASAAEEPSRGESGPLPMQPGTTKVSGEDCAAEANALVRLFTVETLLAEVNPAEWAYIEAELNNKTVEFVKAKKFDEAIAWLKGYRRVRTHSIKLDGKQKAIEAELVKIGVEDENMKPILDATGALVGKVENILNTLDDATNTVSAADGKTATGGAPDLDAYKSELETYRQALLRCNCTEDEANGIVDKFRKDVDPLLEAVSKAAAKGAGKTEGKAPMGTGTINARIDKMTARLLKDVKAKKAAYLVAFRKANVKTMTEKMVAEMKKCVAEGKFEKAREAFWKATSTKDVDMNNLLRKPGVELMLTLVNPKH